MFDDFINKEPNIVYDYLLRGPLSTLYGVRKKNEFSSWMNYSNLLIDKFAIQSSSFFHLSQGIIERKNSGEVRIAGYDLFTVNATFRAMMETYAAFHHIFVEPKTEKETEFRFLLWKLDSLIEKRRFEIYESDFAEVKDILEKDTRTLNETISDIERCEFFKSLPSEELRKIYNPEKQRYSWRFLYSDAIVRPLKINELIKYCLASRGFVNTYRYTSIHAHSNYLALEHFEQTRGKPISESYTQPLDKLAILLTAMLIDDLCKIDKTVFEEFKKLPPVIQEFIYGMGDNVRKSKK